MPNKIKSKFNKGKCQCGKDIVHHHYYCDDCWNMLKESDRLKKSKERENERNDD